MILQSLHALYGRLRAEPSYQVPAQGYSLQKITFKVVIMPQGAPFEIQDARQPVQGNLRPRQELVPGDSKPSGQGINPCFLWDNTGYLLGYKPDDTKPDDKPFEEDEVIPDVGEVGVEVPDEPEDEPEDSDPTPLVTDGDSEPPDAPEKAKGGSKTPYVVLALGAILAALGRLLGWY